VFVRLRQCVSASILFVFLSACSGLPSSGPSSKAILAAGNPQNPASLYQVVDIDPHVVNIVSSSTPRGFAGKFKSLGNASPNRIGSGDSLSITIFESSTGGLFSSAVASAEGGASRVTLPVQTVDEQGNISVPYAGRVAAAGRSPAQIQKTIESRLAKKAIEPQVIVTVTSNLSHVVSVTGDVAQGSRISLSVASERVLDAVASAGGPKSSAFETYVKLTRGSQSEDMLLQSLINSPKDNVKLQAGDQIFLYRQPKKFIALGASTTNSQLNFEADALSLAEAVARMGGLDDSRADPAGVFVFRFEDSEVFEKVAGVTPGSSQAAPIVYRLNLKQPAGLLLAQRFPVKDKDVIYIANSSSTEFSKFLEILGSGVGVAANSSVLATKIAN
jgi:polysaccharide biosynthesis/export protein